MKFLYLILHKARQPRISLPRVSSSANGSFKFGYILKPLKKQVLRKAQCKYTNKCISDGCLTDPEPGMDSPRVTVRNMRSKCRCSCVLQFTFRRAVSCVLHRPPSQTIHCIMLYFCLIHLNKVKLQIQKEQYEKVSHLFTRKKGSKKLKQGRKYIM